MFRKSDESLIFFYNLLVVLSIIMLLGCIVGAIFCWTTSSIEINDGYTTETVVSGLRVGLGFVFLFIGPLAVWVNYKIVMIIICALYDIKLIRNKLYNVNSKELYESLFSDKEFSEEKIQDLSIEENINKPLSD
ncbi:MAG: hypothetical protein GX756_05855 [Clostridiales bacterium]|nr:hypothetical protein [Clostridiales bacterium]